jgi:hypothetical protein
MARFSVPSRGDWRHLMHMNIILAKISQNREKKLGRPALSTANPHVSAVCLIQFRHFPYLHDSWPHLIFYKKIALCLVLCRYPHCGITQSC